METEDHQEIAGHEPQRHPGKRQRKYKRDAEIVLICNPRAGGRWKELAGILDAEEAQQVRRIVTDSVEDIALALSDLGREAKLICIYGGDGTIQRVLDRLSPSKREEVHLALLGGGTMNVTSRWCGFSSSPARNFRYVVRAYRSGDLLLKEVPILEVDTGSTFNRGFTFGMGPVVRLLDAWERGPKGKLSAISLAAKAVSAAWIKRPSAIEELLRNMEAEVELDGERLPSDRFAAVFANVTGQINPGVEPFVGQRERDRFFCAAYSAGARELSLVLPLLLRGWLSVDPVDVSSWLKAIWPGESGQDTSDDNDSRYLNKTASSLIIRSHEPIYTLDGEILEARNHEISVHLGPMLKLAVGSGRILRTAAEAVKARSPV